MVLVVQDFISENKTDAVEDYQGMFEKLQSLLESAGSISNEIYAAFSNGKDVASLEENLKSVNLEIDSILMAYPFLEYAVFNGKL